MKKEKKKGGMCEPGKAATGKDVKQLQQALVAMGMLKKRLSLGRGESSLAI